MKFVWIFIINEWIYARYFLIGISLGDACTHSFNCTSTTTDSECKSLTCQCTGTHFQQNNMCVSSKYKDVQKS